MLDPKMEKALNEQVNAEMYSSYFYLAMAAWLEDEGLGGMGAWMRGQAEEEMAHAMRLYGYIQERGGRVIMAAIEAPPLEWKNAHDVFEKVLEHEMKVTGMINDLVTLSRELGDYATENVLQWFVSEQVEEEASVQEILDKFKLGEGHPGFLFMLDKELNARPTQLFGAPAEGK